MQGAEGDGAPMANVSQTMSEGQREMAWLKQVTERQMRRMRAGAGYNPDVSTGTLIRVIEGGRVPDCCIDDCAHPYEGGVNSVRGFHSQGSPLCSWTVSTGRANHRYFIYNT